MNVSTKRRAQKKPIGIHDEPGESNGQTEAAHPGQLGDWLDDNPQDLREAAIDFDNLKTKAENAAEKFELAKHELNRLRRQYKVARVRIGTSTKFVEFTDSETTRFKIVKMNKPQAVVDAEREDRGGGRRVRENPTKKIEAYRVDDGPLWSTPDMKANGAFRIPCGLVVLTVVSSDGTDVDDSIGEPWEHVSVSLPVRCPTWAEMDFVKRIFWRDDELVVQFHVPRESHINNHEFCLHLWKPIGVELPLPPKGDPVEVELLEWAKWFETGDRVVKQDTIGDVGVSTVFLGLDHRAFGDGPPILWETMIFGGDHDGACWRYPNKVAALAGHDQAVALMKERTT